MKDKKLAYELYRSMLRIRLCEEKFVEPILTGEIRCPVHLYSGQEAIAVGVCANLNKSDYILGTHRSHGHYLAKGGSINEMVAEIFGKNTGCSKGRGGSMHLIDPENGMLGSAPIVAGTISLATGAALSSFIRNDKRVTISFFGDGATGEGSLHESLNFASLNNLPIVFVCENNLYSTHMPIREIRKLEDISTLALPYDISSFRIDGNNLIEVYDTARVAIEKCRTGEGPVFIEALTYRFRGHVGPDDNIQGEHTDIRPKSEVNRWLEKDPITRFKEYVLENDLLSHGQIEEIFIDVQNEIKDAFDFARKSPKPQKEELNSYVFK